jgi:hypothetical protein
VTSLNRKTFPLALRPGVFCGPALALCLNASNPRAGFSPWWMPLGWPGAVQGLAIRAVNRLLSVSRVIDLSAAPFFLRGSGYRKGTSFPWTMSDFSLMDAIECGIVKLPRVPVAENIPGQEMPVFRDLWENLKNAKPRLPRGGRCPVTPGRYTPFVLPALFIHRRLIAFLTLRHDPQKLIRQRPLQCDCIVNRGIKPNIPFLWLRMQHRHRLGVNCRATSFDCVMRNANRLCSPLSPFRSPVHNRHMPAKANSGQLSSSANQRATFGRLSVHSQNDVAGTKQRHSAFN